MFHTFILAFLIYCTHSNALPNVPQSKGYTASKNGESPRYVIMDNDWNPTGFIPPLLALDAGIKVLALASDTADSWVDQHTFYALGLLEAGNLSCIPVVKGETYPLLQTEERLQTWQQLWGKLAWQGVFAPENDTKESQGGDPTGGDPSRVAKALSAHGSIHTKALPGISAAEFMIQQVHKYPGKVSIYSAGALTNIATAIRLDSSFASTAKELIVMGGMVDLNIFRLQSPLDEDIGSDFNFIADPEAAHIAVTANFPSITMVGNVANQQFFTQGLVDKISSTNKTKYAALLRKYFVQLPLWDETPAAILAHPEIVTKKTSAYIDVNTAFDSPNLGQAFYWSKEFAPRHTRSVDLILAINQTAFFELVEHAVVNPQSCPKI